MRLKVKLICLLNFQKVIVVGTVEGVENGESDKKWDFSIFQNNDIHFYIDQNAEKITKFTYKISKNR